MQGQRDACDQQKKIKYDEVPKIKVVHDVMSSMRPRVISVELIRLTPRECISERSRRPEVSIDVSADRSTVMEHPEQARLVHVSRASLTHSRGSLPSSSMVAPR